jgi:hypothetical protein
VGPDPVWRWCPTVTGGHPLCLRATEKGEGGGAHWKETSRPPSSHHHYPSSERTTGKQGDSAHAVLFLQLSGLDKQLRGYMQDPTDADAAMSSRGSRCRLLALIGSFIQEELAARWEGLHFCAHLHQDAQFVASRVQHHVHVLDKDRNIRVPLTACKAVRKAKGIKKDRPCKHSFPKTEQLFRRATVLCKGIAKKHTLNTTGRRGVLGLVAGPRDDEWLSGTALGFTSLLRCNTNTTPNFRLPITLLTHDDDCKRRCVSHQEKTLRRICMLLQLAQTRTTGYFTGYSTKTQPVGMHEMKAAARCADQLQHDVEGDSTARQLYRFANRTLSDLECRGVVRTATETCNLAANQDDQDVKRAEFITTYRTVSFQGRRLVKRFDEEQRREQRRVSISQSHHTPTRRAAKKDISAHAAAAPTASAATTQTEEGLVPVRYQVPHAINVHGSAMSDLLP